MCSAIPNSIYYSVLQVESNYTCILTIAAVLVTMATLNLAESQSLDVFAGILN